MAPQTNIPSIGTNGTQGVLNSLFISGLVLRKTITATQTSIKANKVPILVMSPTIFLTPVAMHPATLVATRSAPT